MKIKKLSKIKVNSFEFSIVWDNKDWGGSFDYASKTIRIGTASKHDSEIFMILCHELMEICEVEMATRLARPDVRDDYIFVCDHRKFDTKVNMFSSLISQFLK